jgi:alkanesulfonate monooxygenase SsuD/methylene tetrahydromethanopterin reductase-like flavin-dependent oxidoreductase (luciferase family)
MSVEATQDQPTRIRFGALLLPSQPWDEMALRAREVEAAGFDALWIDDHIVHPTRPDAHWMECWTTLAGLAGATERIALGPLVSNIVLRPPAVLAHQALTVAELSGGRLDLGVGSGYAPTDHAAVGEEVWPGDERLRRFAAAVAAIGEALRGAVADPAPPGDAGPATAGAANRPSPIPLTVAAHGRGALAIAAAHADTWVSFGGFELDPDAAFDLTRRRSELLTDLADGRPIRRRLLCGSAALTREPIWRSVDAFDDFVGRYRAIGIDEFAFHWPPTDTNPAADHAVVEEIVARLRASR